MRGSIVTIAVPLLLALNGQAAPAQESDLEAIHQFEDVSEELHGQSGITVSSLTDAQVENVAVLGMVWGFLKYHHPRVAAGELQWDLELFRVLPDILAAADAETRNRRLVQWVDELGVPESCDPCATPPENAQLLPRLDWTDDVEQLGTALARRLRDIHTHRFSGVEQHYVHQNPGVGNPIFDNERDYPSQRPPDAGYRILSLLRLWNIIEYWFPYRDLLDEDWQAVLREFLPRLVAADSWDAYRLELLAFTTRIHDTHANLFAEWDVRPPRGRCSWPVEVRFVEGRGPCPP